MCVRDKKLVGIDVDWVREELEVHGGILCHLRTFGGAIAWQNQGAFKTHDSIPTSILNDYIWRVYMYHVITFINKAKYRYTYLEETW